MVVYGTEAQVTFGSPRGIAMNADRGEIYLANTSTGQINIFDFKGRPKTRFFHRVVGSGNSLVDGQPRGIASDKSGRLFVVDNLAAYVDVLDFRGRSVAKLQPGAPGKPVTLEAGAAAVTVAPDGSVLVATRGPEGRIYTYGPDLAPTGSWGEGGAAAGKIGNIVALGVLQDGNIAVVCQNTELAVQVFDPKGAYVRGWGRHEVGIQNFSIPSGLAITGDGRIWVSDESQHVAKVFDPAGGYLGMIGGFGKSPGDFFWPSAIASDGRSTLAVVDREGGRFQILTER